MREIRILIVDDSMAIRDLLRRTLSKVEGLNLIGMAADRAEAIRMIGALQPNIVVMDISMPHKDGIEALKEIRQASSSVAIMMFTEDPSFLLREACFEAGANFYFDKSEIDELLITCRRLLAE